MRRSDAIARSRKAAVEDYQQLLQARRVLDEHILEAERLISALDNIIELERRSPSEEPLQMIRLSSKRSQGRKSARTKGITQRWLGHCEQFLLNNDPCTVPDLLQNAPVRIVNDLESVGEGNSLTFRARRMLRRDNRFLVDAKSGIVRLQQLQGHALFTAIEQRLPRQKKIKAPEHWPNPIGMGFTIDEARLVDGEIRVAGFQASMSVHWELTIDEIAERILRKNDVWVHVHGKVFEGVAAICGDDGKARIQAYRPNEWTRTLSRMLLQES